MNTFRITKIVLGSVVGLGVTPSYAQMPQRTTATYADWTVSCMTVPNSGDKKACAIVQTQQGDKGPVGITVGRATKNDAYKIFLQIPSNVWLQSGASFRADEAGLNLTAPFRWCVPARCLADADLSDADVEKLRAQKESGTHLIQECITIADVFGDDRKCWLSS
jgi:invasion protein IalB